MNKFKKMGFSLLATFLITSAVSVNIKPVEAATYNVQERFLGQWRAVAGNAGLYGNGTILTVNGEPAFCLQANKGAVTGNNSLINFSDIGIDQNKEKRLALIKNFGYMAQPSDTNNVLTTNLLWRELGFTCYYVSPSEGYPTWESMQPWMNDVLNKVNSYQTGVSFDKTTFEVNVGETVTLTDTNNVLQNMQVVSSDGLQVAISGNKLLVTGTANANDSSQINLKKFLANGQEGGNFVVRKGNSQAVSILKTSDPLISKLTVKVNKNYQVAFNGNGATTGSMTNQTFLYNQSQALKANAFSKVGHTFGGWNTAANGSGTNYSNQQSVKNLTNPNTTVTLYAKWVNTPPAIVTPVVPNPNPPGASNIPPFIDGGMLIMQIGDKFEPKKYFTATDIEDGDITSKIVITSNPVPVDKDSNTTTSGDYVVTAKVTDLGGLSATANLTVHVNQPPEIKAEDRWFLQDQEVDRDKLLEQVIATDKEDGDLHDKVVIDWIKYHDGRYVENPTSFDTTFINETGVDDIKYTVSEIQYTVTDKYKKSATTTAKLHIARDIQKFKPKRKRFIRYISLEYIDTLDPTSIWRVNPEYNKVLMDSLTAKEPKAVYTFSHDDVEEIKQWLRENKPSYEANVEYVDKFLNPHLTKGGLD